MRGTSAVTEPKCTATDETPTAIKIVSPVSTTQRLNPNFSIIETTTPDETT